jgi:hypothetical protein
VKVEEVVACGGLFFFYGWLNLAPLRNQSTNFGNPGLAGVLWATARDAAARRSLAFSALNPLENHTLSKHRILDGTRGRMSLAMAGTSFGLKRRARRLTFAVNISLTRRS